jgi:hypothetical protein
VDKLQKMGGIAALLEASLYISAFIFFGAFWDFPVQAGFAEQLDFLRVNQVTLAIVNLFIYVVFGIFLAVLVLALHERLKVKSMALSQIATIFGLIWVGLVIASGMISNIGLNAVIELSVDEPEQARSVWLAVNAVAEGIGGGNEIVGGLWVLLLSIAALKGDALSKKLNYLGAFVGLAGILTVYPAEILTVIFGLSQIVWFLWLGLVMLRKASKS